MNDIADLGFRFTSDGLETANENLENLVTNSEAADKAVDNLGKTSDKTSKSTEELGKASDKAAKSAEDLGKSSEKAGGATASFGDNIMKALSAQEALSSGSIAFAGILGGVVGGAIGVVSELILGLADHFVELATSIAMAGVESEAQMLGLTVMANTVGVTTKELEAAISAVQALGIAQNDAEDAVSQMILAQQDAADTAKLYAVALDVSVLKGEDAAKVFEQLTVAIQSGNQTVLRRMGLMADFDTAYDRMAQSLNKNVSDLTMAEKQQARFNAEMEAGARVAGAYSAISDTAAGSLKEMSVALSDAQGQLGELALPATTVLFELLKIAIEETVAAVLEFSNSDFGKAALAALGVTALGLIAIFSAVIYSIGQVLRAIGAFATAAAKLTSGDLAGAKKAAIDFSVSYNKAAASESKTIGVLTGAMGTLAKATGEQTSKAKAAVQAQEASRVAAGQRAQAQAKENAATQAYSDILDRLNPKQAAANKIRQDQTAVNRKIQDDEVAIAKAAATGDFARVAQAQKEIALGREAIAAGDKKIESLNKVKGASDSAAKAAQRRAETLGREMSAMDENVKANLALADAYKKSDSAVLEAQAYHDGASKAIKKQADIESYVAKTMTENAADMIADTAKKADALRFESKVRTELNAKVLAGTMTAEQEEEQLKLSTDLRWLEAAAVKATGDVKKGLISVIQELTEAQKENNAVAKETAAIRDIRDTQDDIDQIRLETEYIGQSAEALAKANAELKIQQWLRDNSNVSPETQAKYVQVIRDQVDAQNKLNQSTRDYQAELERANNILSDNADLLDSAAAGLRSTMGDIGGAFGDSLTVLHDYYGQITAIATEAKKAFTENAADSKAFYEAQETFARRMSNTQKGLYGDMLQSAKGFFKEGSAGWKVLNTLEQIFRLQEMQASMQAMEQSRIEAQKMVDAANEVAAAKMRAASIQMIGPSDILSGNSAELGIGKVTGGGGLGGLLGGGGGLFKNLTSSITGGITSGFKGLMGAFSANPLAMGATIAGSLIGGKTGGNIANIGMGLMMGGPIGGLMALLGAGGLLGGLFGGKPTNAGAGYDLNSGAFSGNKRTSETEGYVKQAGEAIKQGQELLKTLGATLTTVVNGLVIGTRDQSQIYMSNGKTLTSAKGDATAAAETALRAVLESATFADAGLKRLVDSLLAANKGFDEITKAMQEYAEAQQMVKDVADAILKFKDPLQYEVNQVKKANDDRIAQAKAAYQAGYLTIEQFNQLNDQLRELNSLEMADTIKKNLTDLEGAVTAAKAEVLAAYQAEASAIQATIDKFNQLAQSLHDYSLELNTGPQAMLSPEEQYRQTKALFEATQSAAMGGDVEALGDLQDVSEQYLSASKAYYGSSLGYFKDLALVKAAVQQAETYAKSQVSIAEQQLNMLKESVKNLIEINGNTKSLGAAIAGLSLAMSNLASAQAAAQAAATGSDETARANAYLAANPDVQAAWDQGTFGAREWSTPQEWAAFHFQSSGQSEGRQFARGTDFAPGGLSLVGERGMEMLNIPRGSQVIPNDTLRMMAGGATQDLMGVMRSMTAELVGLRSEVKELQDIIDRGNDRIVESQQSIDRAQADRDAETQNALYDQQAALDNLAAN